jgi:hypothetical protein
MEQLAALFGTSDSTVHRVTGRTAPPLADPLGPPPTDRREPRITGGTLIPVHNKHRTAKSKNHRRSVNTQIAEPKQWRPLQRWIGRREYFDETVLAIAGLVSDRCAER